MSNSWIGNYSYFRARIDIHREAVYDLDAGTHYSYGDLERRANVLANYLQEQLGIVKDDRIAFISRNSVEMIDAYFATGKLGAIYVPYNARLSVQELSHLIKSETPRVLFYEEIFAEKIAQLKSQCSSIEKFVVVSADKNPEGDMEYGEILGYANDSFVGCGTLDMEDIHMIIHTGGTTGLPKGGLISHRCELFNSFNEICTWGLNYQDSTLLLLPMFHTGGWNLLTLPLLHVGGRLIINKQFDPKKTLEVVEQEKITTLFGAATLFRMMVELPEFESTDFSSVKWVMAGATPTPINIMEQFWNKGTKFVLGYGMTEAGPNNLSSVAHFMEPKLIKDKYASVGKPMYLSLAKLVDYDGKEITEPDAPGELLWAGPQIFSGYWNNPQETDKTLVDGWIHTGDMATRDEDGYYYIVGRKKNMFISGGENVFPPEIERAMYDLAEIHEVCVFGVPDERWGEVGKAIVSLKPGKTISKQEIIQQLSTKLAKYKIPKYISFVDEVPKNNVGKIVVAKVVELFGNPAD